MSKLFIILLCFCISIGLVVVLYFISFDFNKGKNGFMRKPIHGDVIETSRFRLSNPDYYIAGLSSSTIYLGNSRIPFKILAVDLRSSDTLTYSFFETYRQRLSQQHKIVIDSPYVYLTDALVPAFLTRTFEDSSVSNADWLTQRCDESIPVSHHLFIGRFYNIKTRKNDIIRLDNKNKSQVRSDILEKQLDGFFCTDGTLCYNKPTAGFIYVYRYRNTYVSIDTNLKMNFVARTIDTTRTAKIEVGSIRDGKENHLLSADVIPNYYGTCNGKYLLIHSGLKADNETDSLFDYSTLIDVYRIDSPGYRGSFYIPKINTEQVQDMKLDDRTLYILQGSLLRTFNISMLLYQEQDPG